MNQHLQRAHQRKDNEYFTSYQDIAGQFSQFAYAGKRVYCPCDDYRKSNFVRWFTDNYHSLGLKHLTATCYQPGARGLSYDFDGEAVTVTELNGDGDFRSDECAAIRDACDCIITNPPFSLIREYFHDWARPKEYAYLAPITAAKSPSVFADVRDGKAAILPSHIRHFDTPGGVKHFGNIIITTNMPTTRQPGYHKPTAAYNPAAYKMYDNYAAINVDRYQDMPADYGGLIGVPITYLPKVDRSLYDVVAVVDSGLHISGREVFARLMVQKRGIPQGGYQRGGARNPPPTLGFLGFPAKTPRPRLLRFPLGILQG